MKRPIESITMILLLLIFGLIVLHAPLTVFFGTLLPDGLLWPGTAFWLKSWKELLMVLAAGLLVFEITRRQIWSRFATDKLFWAIVLFAALHFATGFFLPTAKAAFLAGIGIDLRYILYFGLVYAGLTIYPAWRQMFLKVGLIGAFIVISFGVLQLFLPHDILKYIGYSLDTIAPYGTVDRNYDFVRINSTLRGPNPLGAYAAGAAILALSFILASKNTVYKRYAAGFIVLSGVVLLASFSRSAAVALLVGFGIVAAVILGRKLSKSVMFGGIGAVVLVLILLLSFGRSNAFLSNIIYHEDPGEGGAIDSNQAHVDSLGDGFKRMLNQPFGAGIGSTGSASLLGDKPLIIENQYLFIAHETGWLGLVLFLAIFGEILRRLWILRSDWLALGVFAGGIALAAIGLLLPVWVDDTVAIIWWGLAAIVLTKGVSNAATTKQKTTRTT